MMLDERTALNLNANFRQIQSTFNKLNDILMIREDRDVQQDILITKLQDTVAAQARLIEIMIGILDIEPAIKTIQEVTKLECEPHPMVGVL